MLLGCLPDVAHHGVIAKRVAKRSRSSTLQQIVLGVSMCWAQVLRAGG